MNSSNTEPRAWLQAVRGAMGETVALTTQAPVHDFTEEVYRCRVGPDWMSEPGAGVDDSVLKVERRLMLTRGLLLEMQPGTHDVRDRRNLGELAAVVQLPSSPQLFALEWADGSEPSVYQSTRRDEILAAVLDVGQTAAKRPLPVLQQPTQLSQVLRGSSGLPARSCAVVLDHEVEESCRNALASAVAGVPEEHALSPLDASLSGLGPASASPARRSAPLKSAFADNARRGAGLGARTPPPAAHSPAALAGNSLASTPPPTSSPGGWLGRGLDAATPEAAPGSPLLSAADPDAEPGAGQSGFLRSVHMFNASVPYSGVSSAFDVGMPVVNALFSLLPAPLSASADAGSLRRTPPDGEAAMSCVAALQAMQRMASCGRMAERMLQAVSAVDRTFAALTCGHDAIALEAARLLSRIWFPSASRVGAAPWRLARDETMDSALRNDAEETSRCRAAKSVALRSEARQEQLIAPLREAGSGKALVRMALVVALGCILAEPGCQTTDVPIYASLLGKVASMGLPLFMLVSHPAAVIADGTAVIMRAIAERGAAVAEPMRAAALQQGAMLHHLKQALDNVGAGAGAGTARSGQSKISRELLALWADQYGPAMALLRRIFPRGLIAILNQQLQPSAPPAKPPAPQLQAGDAARPSSAAAGSAAAGPQAAPSPPQGSAPPADASRTAASTPPAAAAAAAAAEPQDGRASASAQLPGQAAAPRPGAGEPAVAAGGGNLATASQGQPASAAVAADAAAGKGSGTQPVLGSARTQQHMLKMNWGGFWTNVLWRNHHNAGLIWNEQTRTTLRYALSNELERLESGRRRVAERQGARPVWNWGEFAVRYPELDSLLCIDGIFVHLLLDGSDPEAVTKLVSPKEFFGRLYHHFLCKADSGLQLLQHTGAPQADSSAVSAVAQAVHGDAELERETCIRAMAAVYQFHAGAIGSFDGLPHVLALLDCTMNRSLRHQLLQLVRALILPRNAASDSRSARAAQGNADLLLQHDGVQLLVDLLTTAHEQQQRSVLSGTTKSHMITASEHVGWRPQWHYYEPAAAATQPPGAAPPQPPPPAGEAPAMPGMKRVGPISKAQIKQLYAGAAASGGGRISLTTPVWVSGMMAPKPLWAMRELRWLLAQRNGPLTSFQVAELVLEILQRLADSVAAIDVDGCILLPLPAAHRTLSSPACLPHICQLLLTMEPRLVEGAARLLTTVVRHNDTACSQLYRTGVFYFALAYTGSNLLQLACLLRVSHLHQHFLGDGGDDAGWHPSSKALHRRSFLGRYLPESLLYQLEYPDPPEAPGQEGGSVRFARALCQEVDSPEVLWTRAMRTGTLLPEMQAHLGDFPAILPEHCHAVYDHVLMPSIQYAELDQELWCHRYYLRALCSPRFKSHPIQDHEMLMRALLEAWRKELDRKPMSMSQQEALQVLGFGLDEGGGMPDMQQLKKVYRQLAREFHPDKNPAGRDRFLAVQEAYDRLLAGDAGGRSGPDPDNILLILKAQGIVYERHSDIMNPYRYAGYPQLLEVVQDAISAGGRSFFSPQQADLVRTAVRLCWLTCRCAAENGEELIRCGGTEVIGSLLSRCVSLLPTDCPPTDGIAAIATWALRTLMGLASFPEGRRVLEGENQRMLVGDIVRCCTLQRAVAATEAALDCCRNMAASAVLQEVMLEKSALSSLMLLMLELDPTHTPDALATAPKAGDSLDDGDRMIPTDLQRCKNLHAEKAVWTLACMCGFQPGFPASQQLREVLAALLTPNFFLMMRESRQRAMLLRSLATTVEEPWGIWTEGMRGALKEALLQQAAAPDLQAAASFRFDALQDELIVPFLQAAEPGCPRPQVYLRIFLARQQPRLLAFPAPAEPPPAAGAAPRQPSLAPELSLALQLTVYLYEHALAPGSGGAGGVWAEDPPPNGGTDAAAGRDVLRRRSHLLSVLEALRKLLDLQPSLMGALANPAALQPLMRLVSMLSFTSARFHSQPAPPLAFPSAAAGVASDPDGDASAAPPGAADAADADAPAAQPSAGPADLRPSSASSPDSVASGPAGPGLSSASAAGRSAGTAFPRMLKPRFESAVAESTLLVLLKLVENARCVAALSAGSRPQPEQGATDAKDAQEHHGAARRLTQLCLRHLFWTIHRPPTFATLELALRVLKVLSNSSAASEEGARGGALFLLAVVLPEHEPRDPGSRRAQQRLQALAAFILSRLLRDRIHGDRLAAALSRLLPGGVLDVVREGEEQGAATLRILDSSCRTPELVWDAAMKQATVKAVLRLSAEARAVQAAGKEWTLPAGQQVRHEGLEGERYIGGVYLRLYLKDPTFKLRNAKRFCEALVPAFLQSVEAALPVAGAARRAAGESSGSDAEAEAKLLAGAVVALTAANPQLSDHAAGLGYVAQLLEHLYRTARLFGEVNGARPDAADGEEEQPVTVPSDKLVLMGGSQLQVLRQMSCSAGVGEAVASTRRPAAETLMSCCSWPGTISTLLALQCLKHLLSSSNRKRDALVAQIVGTPTETSASNQPIILRLVAMLPNANKQEAGGQKQAGALMALIVDILKSLLQDGAWNAQAQDILDGCPEWRACRDRNHALYLPSGVAQGSGDIVGLLEDSEIQRYALPDPRTMI